MFSVTHRASQDCTECGEDYEANVGAIGYSGVPCCVDVLTQRDKRADNATEVEDDPEPGDVSALGVLGGGKPS